ncbi:MAG: FapA family protein, partial [Candidatus Hydrogenedentes bacterium]|nr:FapA family protein [Candidatus Hydrogenedentota bacterium]
VEKDQLLAEIVPSAPGQNGQDVFGRMVPAREPRPAPIREGKNTRFETAGQRYFAETSGQVRYLDDVLFVDDVFRVKGDAGLRTGNIDHPGALIIERDIQSDMVVKASGDIDIGENIEDAIVESGGNITVHGGISCKERGVIKVAGNLHARFIRNTDIDAGGDIYVDGELNQCNIRTRGAVIVKQGRIVGGSIIALKGVETQDLGSEACIPGNVTVGKDYTMEATVAKMKSEVESARELVLKLRDTIAPLRAKRDSLTPRMQQQLAQLTEELKKREATYDQQDKSLKSIFTATKRAAVPHIYVHGTVYPDNLIQVRAQVKKIKETVAGPLRFSLRKGKFSVFRLKDGESLEDKS